MLWSLWNIGVWTRMKPKDLGLIAVGGRGSKKDMNVCYESMDAAIGKEEFYVSGWRMILRGCGEQA